MTIKEIVGKTISKIDKINKDYSDRLVFNFNDGTSCSWYHSQDCCEAVYIEDVCGNLDDLIGSPLLIAEENSNSESLKPDLESESFTWTFYKFATIKGYVDVRWFGSSNGYYSESVDFWYSENKY